METIAPPLAQRPSLTPNSTGSNPMSRANSTVRPTDTDRKNKSTVLVVDDEKDLLDLITYNLQRNGYTVLTATSGDAALALAEKNLPDLVLLDLMLPGMNGTDVARKLKADPRTAAIPIIMLTAKSEETDVIVGLTLGADDYVCKPFSMKILLARMNTVLRRSEPVVDEEEAILKLGPLIIDPAKHEATVDGNPVKLTFTEFKLLSALVAARGRVLTRDQLMTKAMGSEIMVTDRAIDVHITAIRKKLAPAGWLVRTVRGVGYSVQETPGDDAE